jgi:hypothetical protein
MFYCPAGLKNLAQGFNLELNGAKIRRIWGDFLRREGLQDLEARGFKPRHYTQFGQTADT